MTQRLECSIALPQPSIEEVADLALVFREKLRLHGDGQLLNYADMMLYAIGKAIAKKSTHEEGRALFSHPGVYVSQ